MICAVYSGSGVLLFSCPHLQADPTGMERACCAVLLSDIVKAKQLLGLGPGAAPGQQGDPEIHAFVKVSPHLHHIQLR